MTTPMPGPGQFNYGQFQQQANGLVTNPGAGFSVSGRGGKMQDSTPVYLGGGAYQGSTFTKTYTPYGEARLDPLNWDDAKMRSFVAKGILAKAPGFGTDMGMPEIVSAWDDLLKSASAFNAMPGQGKEWTPFDVLETYSNNEGKFGTVKKGDWLYDVATGEKVKYVGPKTKTRTDKRIDLSSPEDVKALTTQMLTELLGRAPNANELAKYRSSINNYETANPQLATTTEKLNDMGEVVSSSTVTAGGASEAASAQLISDAAKQGPEYGKFQGATTYYNAMMQMLSGG